MSLDMSEQLRLVVDAISEAAAQISLVGGQDAFPS